MYAGPVLLLTRQELSDLVGAVRIKVVRVTGNALGRRYAERRHTALGVRNAQDVLGLDEPSTPLDWALEVTKSNLGKVSRHVEWFEDYIPAVAAERGGYTHLIAARDRLRAMQAEMRTILEEP